MALPCPYRTKKRFDFDGADVAVWALFFVMLLSPVAIILAFYYLG